VQLLRFESATEGKAEPSKGSLNRLKFLFSDFVILYLCRHGETTGDMEDRYGGDYDDNLTPKGITESEELAKKLKGKDIQILYTSPRIRAIETTSIVNKTLNVPLKIIDNLRERNNYGILTGLIKSEAKERHPEEVKELEKGKLHKVKDSEEYMPFKNRVIKAFMEITANSKYETVGIITHGGPIRCVVRELLGLGELKEGPADCAIFTLEFDKGKFNLKNVEGALIS
jgi:probable phosphoglycerate mutase